MIQADMFLWRRNVSASADDQVREQHHLSPPAQLFGHVRFSDRPVRVTEMKKQGQFRRKHILVIAVMICGLKGRLAKQNNRKKTGSNFKSNYTILCENRFSFSRRLAEHPAPAARDEPARVRP